MEIINYLESDDFEALPTKIYNISKVGLERNV